MGNENSHLSGLEIEEKSVQISDFWSQHSANIVSGQNVTNLSVFIGDLFVDGALWVSRTPLEKNSKNLMIYRHPCILKYISSWHKNSKYYLAVEEIKPLNHVLAMQTPLQICIGLYSILKALCFLHETAQVSHNNVCTSSIYVTKDGSWKLGSMEYLCKFSELTTDYLNKTRSNRYSKALDSNEDKNIQNRKDIVDVFAFGVLVSEVLKSIKEDEIPMLTAFQELAKNELQHINILQRPKLTTILKHEFFNHDFIRIHSFLLELPLKSDEEKTAFFSGLVERLRTFQEVTVASQLGGLLLSRMVLLNKTAQNELIPLVLSPYNDNCDNGFFSETNFKKYLVPKLLEIFCVRDAQIRLLILSHFPKFIHTFSKEELQSKILPELLVGIKDTNDHLVAVTLRTLADLVPILGATTVIGGKRAKLFNDGRPTSHTERKTRRKKVEIVESVILEPNEQVLLPAILPERSRPDGEEVETSTEEIEPSVEEDLDNWEDWDVENNSHNHQISDVINETTTEIIPNMENLDPSRVIQKKIIPDITELDIKNQTKINDAEEIDFFEDMEPIIEAPAKFLIEDKVNDKIKSKLSLTDVEASEGDGWGDEEW